MNRQCKNCGLNPAAGYASISKGGVQKWYCHDDKKNTCYERVQVENAIENLDRVMEVFLGRAE